MNFTFTWIMDRLGYMPKIDMQVGKVEASNLPKVKKTSPLPSKTTIAKTARTKKAK
jgi:hypothetical protein